MRRFFFRCHDHDRPTGGQKDTHQHINVVNHLGHDTYAVDSTPGFRLTCFDDSTSVIDENTFRNMRDSARDYVGLAEEIGPQILADPAAKVIFNKNSYTGCGALCVEEHSSFRTADVVGVVAAVGWPVSDAASGGILGPRESPGLSRHVAHSAHRPLPVG